MTDLTLSQINGRFKVRPAGDAAPGCCSVCGNVKNKVVDFGLDVDFYGAVTICTECFVSAAELLNLIPLDRLRTLELQIQGHDDEIEKITKDVDDFVSSINDLYSDFNDRICGASLDDPEPVQEVLDGAESTADSTVEQSDGSLIDEGPAIVSSSISNGFDL